MTAGFVVILNETVMSVALPTLMVQLQITASTAQWLTTGYLLTMAVVIPMTGYLIARFSLRRLYTTAMALFAAGTLMAAVSPGFLALLAGRVVQACGTAIMIPLLMTTVLTVVPVSRRGAMMGRIAIVIAVAPAIGPTISGLVLESLGWRWLFWLVLPIALLTLLLGAWRVTNVTRTRAVALDFVSVPLAALAFGGLVFGLSTIGESAEAEPLVPAWVPLTVGAMALVVFTMRQRVLQRRDAALLSVQVFATRSFTVAALIIAISMLALFGALIVLPVYLQNVLGVSTLVTGLILLPGGLSMAVVSPITGRLCDRIGPKPIALPGAIALCAALWGFTTLDVDTPLPVVAALHTLLSAGLSSVLTPLLASALGALPAELHSHGSAMINTVQQLAGATGTALFITLMAQAGHVGDNAPIVGVQLAFTVGAGLSIISVVGVLFVRGSGARRASQAVVH
ncbi:MDR family MFS transporter [Klenkia sp. LSe6-5]|uniref:MDR family MFS transporter n=1 Tax=Klenkia sesuvii TaxID=3103137 RepID=A0ABU8DWV7_9ACTN